jgi:diguanylate cyclase (GGDEF)-like protein/PAS domain S-box-containing protein
MKIWVRLVLSILLAVVLSGAGLIYWATLAQRQIASDQAREFANSVHQMTLAGLTGMMITGTVPLRSVFLDQISAMKHIESLKVIRGDHVVKQFGPGHDGETLADSVERSVLESGVAFYSVITGRDGDESLRAVLPAIAQENYLGKNCLSCHTVASGTVLGAVSMQISLTQSTLATKQFSQSAILAATALCLPLGLFIWFFISRIVSRPLARMAEGLGHIAEGEIDEAVELPVGRLDEVGVTTVAFNRVMAKATELIKQQRLSRLVFENSLEGISVTDASSRIVMVNKAFTDTTGYSAAEAIGQTPALLRSGRQGDEFYAEFWKTLQLTGEWRGEIWNRRKNGSIYAEWLNVSAVRNPRGQLENYVAIFSDITERKEREDLITHQAFHDALTGLPNRLLFHDRLDQALGQAKRNRVRTPASMFLDLDRFKAINDTLGHDAGDLLLKEVANRLRRCVRAADTVARLAGDEFTILLPEICDESDARAVAEKVLEAMTEPIKLGAESRVISTSIGISLYPRDGRDASTLIKHADAAMYHVKDSGRAGISFFADDLLGKPTRRVEMEERLLAALANREFELDFQPIVDLESGAVHGREALLRWRQSDGAIVVAEDFIGLAEELGLMLKLGEWVLERACVQAREWQTAGHPVIVAVNLSAAEFRRPNIVETIRDILRGAGLSPQLLEIEISEMLAMQDSEYTMRVLSDLADLGVASVIDDFGTGYSNLNVLRQLPIQGVKVDRSLIRDESRQSGEHSVLAAIFGLAQALGLKTIAEGIETPSELEAVRNLACHRAQGVMMGKG